MTGTLTSNSHVSAASWRRAMTIPPRHMIGAVTSTVAVICTRYWICRTSLVLRVSKVGAPNRALSRSEKVRTCSNTAARRSRPKPIPVREPK